VIGRGGFAVVHRGTYRFPREQTPKDVAVKIFHAGLDITTSTAEQIKKELSLGIKLSHPNLLRLFGVLTDPTHGPCLVLELCDGGSLSSVFNDAYEGRITLPWKTRVKWLGEIAVGMDFLHSCQPRIIHRDLKPANVLLSSKDFDAAVAKVADFGVSTTLEKTKMSTASAKGGAGTLAWSAPETFKGEYSEKSDTYAFAMVMYETLTFLRPHAGKSAAEINKMGMTKFERMTWLDDLGVSAEVQEANWLKENPLEARRPDLGQVPRDCPEPLLSLMQTCWSDSPDKRPSFRLIVDGLGKLQDPEYLTIFQAVQRLVCSVKQARLRLAHCRIADFMTDLWGHFKGGCVPRQYNHLEDASGYLNVHESSSRRELALLVLGLRGSGHLLRPAPLLHGSK
jgi:serine/threonine protein kinase